MGLSLDFDKYIPPDGPIAPPSWRVVAVLAAVAAVAALVLILTWNA